MLQFVLKLIIICQTKNKGIYFNFLFQNFKDDLCLAWWLPSWENICHNFYDTIKFNKDWEDISIKIKMKKCI